MSVSNIFKEKSLRDLLPKCKGALKLKREKNHWVYPQPWLVHFLLWPHRASLWWNSPKPFIRPQLVQVFVHRAQEADFGDLTAGPIASEFSVFLPFCWFFFLFLFFIFLFFFFVFFSFFKFVSYHFFVSVLVSPPHFLFFPIFSLTSFSNFILLLLFF